MTEPQGRSRCEHLQLGDDLLLGHVDDVDVLHGKGGIGDDGQDPGIHLFGDGSSGKHGGQDGLTKRRTENVVSHSASQTKHQVSAISSLKTKC